MATTAAVLAVKVIGDATGATKALDSVSKNAGGFERGITSASKWALGAGAALGFLGKEAFNAASDAQQAQGAVDAVFKASSKAIHDYASSAATDTGLAASEYEAMAAVFGAQLKNMGADAASLAPQTNDLIGLGADLAAQFGGSTSDAVAALSSLLRGEADPIERYGVSIKQADKEAYKAAKGLDGLTGEAAKQADMQATLALLTEQTADAQGAFAREANTAAGQQQRASAAYKDASAALGVALLPLVAKAATLMSKLAGFIKENTTLFQGLAIAIGAITAVILAAKVGLIAYHAAQTLITAASKAWAAAQWLVNAALSANPLALVVIGVAALIAGIVLLVKNWDKVKAALEALLKWVKSNWDKLLPLLLGPFGLAIVAIVKNWDKVKAAVQSFADTALRVVQTVVDAIGRVVGVLRGALTAAWNYVRDIAKGVFAAIKAVIDLHIEAIRRIITWLRTSLVSAFTFVRDRASSILRTVREAIDAVVDPIRRLIDWLRVQLVNAVTFYRDRAVAAFNAVKRPIEEVIALVQRLIDWIGKIDFPDVGGFVDKLPFVGSILSAPVPGARTAVAPAAAVGVRARPAASRSGPAPVQITVNGALDPDAVARQIERILVSRSRRVSGVRQLQGVL